MNYRWIAALAALGMIVPGCAAELSAAGARMQRIEDTGDCRSVGQPQRCDADSMKGCLIDLRNDAAEGGATHFSVNGPLAAAWDCPTGQLPERTVQQVIAKDRAGIDACLAKDRAANPMHQGHVGLRWLVLPTGQSAHVKTFNSQGAGVELIECLSAAIGAIRFPVPEGGNKHAVAAAQIKFGERIAPTLRFQPKAAWPDGQKATTTDPEVQLLLTVDPSGSVRGAQVTQSAGPVFDAAAQEIVAKMRFHPGTVDGQPTQMQLHWFVRFQRPTVE